MLTYRHHWYCLSTEKIWNRERKKNPFWLKEVGNKERKKRKGKVPHTPVQGSGAHEPLLSREATSHSLTAMLVWSCRLQSVDTKVLHVRLSRRAATIRGDHMTFLKGRRVRKEEEHLQSGANSRPNKSSSVHPRHKRGHNWADKHEGWKSV